MFTPKKHTTLHYTFASVSSILAANRRTEAREDRSHSSTCGGVWRCIVKCRLAVFASWPQGAGVKQISTPKLGKW